MRNIVNRLLNYLNPISRLGMRRYSFWFPLITALFVFGVIEIYAHWIVRDPSAIGLIAIFIPIVLIIYFAFRDGIRGGLILALLTCAYYAYIISSRNYTGTRFVNAVETTVVLTAVYIALAVIIGWLKQTIDLLIEREADEKRRLQTIIQQLPVGVVITNSKAQVIQVNKQVEKILGTHIPMGLEVGKKAILRVKQNGKELTPSQSPLLQTLTTGKPIVNRQMTVEKNNKPVHIQLSVSAVHNKAGKIIAAAEIITDITHQKEIEERKDDFVNMASHELKTPITSMKLYIDTLAHRISASHDTKALKLIDNIKRQTDKLQGLVSDLLDVSRLQTGKLAFTRQDFSLEEVIAETIESLQGAAGDRKLQFRKHPHIVVFADRFRIGQVVTNLITNALKYSPDEKDVIIRLKREDGKAIVSIQDFGIGIDKEQQKKVFDRLYQVTDSTEKTFPGLGMGLYISKEIIKRHKGRIWVESDKGKGSTFFFSLPLYEKKKDL